ncbi:hypothetical protein MTR_5g038240 [Medicago truncatula]|uniref:Retrotransposon Copia-like N-terminal domain-containing protein n=1 Tax=Medicago truncatula TaxID=3880 RepID=G7K9R2_MEDTR|nr:hypothetical protein MTR_5g038240 [Medicago truncatula]
MSESNSNSDHDVNPTGSKTIKDPSQDPRSLFFLHPSKNSGAVLVSTPLTDHNWSREMKRALSSKNKIRVFLEAFSNSHHAIQAWVEIFAYFKCG